MKNIAGCERKLIDEMNFFIFFFHFFVSEFNFVTCQSFLTIGIFAAVEMLTSSSRLTMAVWLSIVYAVGAMVFTLIAYFVQQWHFLTIYGTSPFVLVFIYCFFLPESPRWLLLQERFLEVEVYARRIASINRYPFNESCQTQLKQIFLQCTHEVAIQDAQVRCKKGTGRLFLESDRNLEFLEQNSGKISKKKVFRFKNTNKNFEFYFIFSSDFFCFCFIDFIFHTHNWSYSIIIVSFSIGFFS